MPSVFAPEPPTRSCLRPLESAPLVCVVHSPPTRHALPPTTIFIENPKYILPSTEFQKFRVVMYSLNKKAKI